MMSFELFLVDPVTGLLSVSLPDATSLTLSPLWSDIGTFSFTYPNNGLGYSSLRTPLDSDQKPEIAVKIDGIEVTSLRFLVESYSGDDADESAEDEWTFSGRSWAVRLEDAVVWVTGSVNQYQTFTSQNPGQIMNTLITAAKARGCFPDLAIDFTNSVDSDGASWPTTYTLDFNAGTTLMSVMQQMVSTGWCEFAYSGRTLRLFRYNTHGTHYDAAGTDLRVVIGRDTTDSPRKRDVTEVATIALVSGANATSVTSADAAALARVGRRRETYGTSGNISDAGTLSVYAANLLQTQVFGNYEKSAGLDFRLSSTPQPWSQFQAGDWLPIEGLGMTIGREALRVKQIAVTFSNDGGISGSLVFNSFLQERAALIALKLAAIENGSSIAGAAQNSTSAGGYIDGIAPVQVTGLSVTSDTYVDNFGVRYAQISATWNASILNTDGTTVSDLNCYRFQWAYTSGTDLTWHEVLPIINSVGVSPVRVGYPIQTRVCAQDQAGNRSAFSAVVTLNTGSDTTPPVTPSTPAVAGYLGAVKITWDGLDNTGAGQPTDFAGVLVHVSLINNFTLSNTHTTYTLLGGQGSVWPSEVFTLGSPYYVKLQAFDKTGNLSGLSAQGIATPQSVLTSDLADSIITTAKLVAGAVGSAQLANLAVQTANIAALAVTDAQIGNVTAGKITVGTLSADITVAARIKTADTGARVELNASGIYAYDSSSNQTIAIASTGSVTVKGTVSTGPLTGQYMVMGPALSSGRPGLLGYSAIAAESSPGVLAIGSGTPSGGSATDTVTIASGIMSTAVGSSTPSSITLYAPLSSGQAGLVQLAGDRIRLQTSSSVAALILDASGTVTAGSAGLTFAVPNLQLGSTGTAFSTIRTGAASISAAAGPSTSISGVISHNCPVAPKIMITNAGSGAACTFSVVNLTATTFQINCYNPTAGAVSITLNWFAIG